MMKNIDRFYGKKWGIFYHFLGGNDAARWNKRVESVKVELWAEQLAELGAGFFGLPLMQVYKCMAAPNAAFDRITGYKPGEACSERDLVLDLSDALRKYDIDLMLYFTGDGPCRDDQNIANRAFGFTTPSYIGGKWVGSYEPDRITPQFVEKWSEVLREYSVRYGGRVFAWWLDGCYPASCNPHFSYTDELLLPYKKAILDGNPEALVTFNSGLKKTVEYYTPLDDFTAGEVNDVSAIPEGRFINGAQWFEFICDRFWYLDRDYLRGRDPGPVMYSPDFMLYYIQKVRDAGGIVMLDTTFRGDEFIDRGQYQAMSKLKYLR